MCESSRWDFSDLSALFLNGTIDFSPVGNRSLSRRIP